jgi:predicted nucleotidyltransferase
MNWKQDETLARLEPGVILCGYRGSIAHGTYEETVTHDDKDIMGIFIPPREVIFGLDNIETVERMIDEKLSEKRTTVWDVVYYSLRKYLSLLLKQNPNILSLLWIEEKFYIKKTYFGELLVSNRDKLISRQCYQSFVGYAYGQLHRMTHHCPTGQMGAKRKELVERFGYDTKNAGHLIRLLKMGLEALTTGDLLIERPDNNMLLEIKRGEWPLQKVLDYSDSLFRLMEEALIKSPLQAKVDYAFVNDLCIKITSDYFGGK